MLHKSLIKKDCVIKSHKVDFSGLVAFLQNATAIMTYITNSIMRVPVTAHEIACIHTYIHNYIHMVYI